MPKTAQQLGIEFQDDVQQYLRSLERKNRIVTLRLYDTRSAGNYLPAQPGDFVTVKKGSAILIEAKSSGKHSSLAGKRAPLTSLFDTEQVAKMRLWHRAGAWVFVIFECQNTKAIEVWRGVHVAEAFVTPRKCLVEDDCRKFDSIEAACNWMVEIP